MYYSSDVSRSIAKLLRLLSLFSILVFFVGCATNDGVSGQNKSSWLPSSNKLKLAAVDAATRVDTWAPAVGAVLFSTTDADKNLSDWAIENTPVFGSQTAAENASDDLREATDWAFAGSVVALGYNKRYDVAALGFVAGMGVEVAALNVVNESTKYLKASVGRERPFGGDFSSFPSRHTSSAVANGTMGKRNLDLIPMNSNVRRSLYYGVTALGVGTAWGRVESHVHYPSDVLAGAALANFTTHFIYNAFLDSKSDINVSVEPTVDGGKMKVQFPF
jgi:membrane-associated phospholipid phosphatase